MAYNPKIVTGMVTGTGWPIDSHVLYFSQWAYDKYQRFHLYGWEDEADEAVMLTMYQAETANDLCTCDTLEAFTEMWKAGEWEPAGAFCLPLDKVEVQAVLQEEEKDAPLDVGIDLSPRKDTDRGGILCLPLDDNLNGDTKKKHPDWEAMDCPHCGRKCWKPAGVDKLQQEQGVQLLCTECAMQEGLVRPHQPESSQKQGTEKEGRT